MKDVFVTGYLAITKLREVVAGKEDFVYWDEFPAEDNGAGACHYEVDGCPACLVGRALHSLGATVDQLKDLDGRYGTVIDKVTAPWLHINDNARQILKAAQRSQDSGGRWGLALYDAEITAHNLRVESDD